MAGRPVVLLTGNGICVQAGQDRFDSIIEKIRADERPDLDTKILEGISFPMKIVMVSGDRVDKYMKTLARKMTGMQLFGKGRIFLKSILDINPCAVLTANYSYELESSVVGKFSFGDYRKYRKNTFVEPGDTIRSQLFQYMDLTEYGCRVPIWHIHGEAHKPNSMVMGHYYYGKLLREIEDYLSGAMSRLKVLYKKEVNPIPAKSWVDLFLLGDVHIVGFSMSLSETDLWWLACCKKRNFSDSRIIYYKDHKENDPGKEEMMRTYGIEVVDMKGKVSDFKGYYEKSLNIIKDCIKQGRSS